MHLDYDYRGQGKPLLFIHGLTFDRSSWEPIIAQLADRFTCLAVDLPGHGGSDGPPMALDDVAFVIHQLLGELGVQPPACSARTSIWQRVDTCVPGFLR